MMSGGHAHGAKPPSGGIMGGGGPGSMLDNNALMKGDFPLALAKMLASSMDPDGFNVMHTVQGGLCNNCTVLGVKMDIVFENGTRADISTGVYLHHIFSMNIVPETQRKLKTGISTLFAPFCSSGTSFFEMIAGGVMDMAQKYLPMPNIQIFGFGAVDEFKQLFTTVDGSFNSGFYFGEKDKLFFQAEVVNYNKEPQTVYIQMDTEFVDGKPEKEAMTSFISTTSMFVPPFEERTDHFRMFRAHRFQGRWCHWQQLWREIDRQARWNASHRARAYACKILLLLLEILTSPRTVETQW
jgi:hypothetical protein